MSTSLNVLAGACASLDRNPHGSQKRRRPSRDIEWSVNQSHRSQPIYDELDPMMMSSDPEAHAPITYKQGYMPFHLDPQLRKASRKNRSSYESICSDFNLVPTLEPPSGTAAQTNSHFRGGPSSHKPQHPPRSFTCKPSPRRFSHDGVDGILNFDRDTTSSANRFSESQMVNQNIASNSARQTGLYTTGDMRREMRQFPPMAQHAQPSECSRFSLSSQEQVSQHHYEHHPRGERMAHPSSYTRASDPRAYGPASHSYAGPPSYSYDASDAPYVPQSIAQRAQYEREGTVICDDRHREQRMHCQPSQSRSYKQVYERRVPQMHSDDYLAEQPHQSMMTSTQNRHYSRRPMREYTETPMHNATTDAHRVPAFDQSEAQHNRISVQQNYSEGHQHHPSTSSCDPGRTRCEPVGSYGRASVPAYECEDGAYVWEHHDGNTAMTAQPTPKRQAGKTGTPYSNTRHDAILSCSQDDTCLTNVPVAKQIIFVEETGQKKPKRAKTTKETHTKSNQPRFILVVDEAD